MKNQKLNYVFIIAIFISTLMGCKVATNDVKPTPVAVLTSVSPAKALPNSAISIIGTNFSTDISKIAVTFNGVAAKINLTSATEIVVTVPATAKTGKLVLISDGTTLTPASDFTVFTNVMQTSFHSGQYVEHIAIDGLGNMYGEAGAVVYKIISPSTHPVLAGTTNTGVFKSLWGIAADASGNVYVADQGKHQIDKITPAGIVTVFAGSGVAGYADGLGTAAQFTGGPFGLAIDASGNLYTNDAFRVRKITPAGLVSTLAGSGTAGYADGTGTAALLGGSEGIATDAASNVYIDDNKSVRKITPAGVVTTLAGNGTAGFVDGQGKTAQLYAPQAMAVDAAGNIFIADNQYASSSSGTTTYVIRMVNKAGLVTSFIKSSYPGFTAPTTVNLGDLTVASTNFPDGIAFDAAGNMYVCNTGTTYGAVTKILMQ